MLGGRGVTPHPVIGNWSRNLSVQLTRCGKLDMDKGHDFGISTIASMMKVQFSFERDSVRFLLE